MKEPQVRTGGSFFADWQRCGRLFEEEAKWGSMKLSYTNYSESSSIIPPQRQRRWDSSIEFVSC